MAVTVKKLTNANVYFDGVSQQGKVSEASLPEIAAAQVDFQALGQNGKTTLPVGFDKMELELKWTAIHDDILKKVSNIYKSWGFQVRSSVEEYDSSGRSAEVSYVAYFRGRATNIPGASFKMHENVEATSKFVIDYYKLEIGGGTVFEVDVLANIYIVNGVDLLATYRANLGI